ncbi:hypothetical protein PHYBOEH_009400 [Phytophthora boehmeriae]|uniref:RxLR effector protein n=1 Tax=Phytophthora boehmeriae TaxID=109152 RepID=A0A8T1VYE7_9STRA|nr:hypothetical protein PHYBOEH_009400 [Phytophthora boehmeriae]
MRPTIFLFLAATALLTSSGTVLAVRDSAQTQLSAMVSPDAMQPTDAAREGKRFLQTTRTQKHDDDGLDDLDSNDDDDGEERSIAAFSSSTSVNKLLKHLKRNHVIGKDTYTQLKTAELSADDIVSMYKDYIRLSS